MSELRNAIRAANDAREKTNQKIEPEPENQKAVKPESQPEEIETVSLTIKVSREKRTQWLIAAKRQRTTLTAAITDALNARFDGVD